MRKLSSLLLLGLTLLCFNEGDPWHTCVDPSKIVRIQGIGGSTKYEDTDLWVTHKTKIFLIGGDSVEVDVNVWKVKKMLEESK